MFKLRNLFFPLIIFSSPAFAATWEIDPSHTAAHFSVRHLMVSNVRGELSSVKGTVEYDPANVEATKIEATIDANTIDTREKKRDDHLKNEDFLDVAKFPTLTFKSKKVSKLGDGKLEVLGDLTIRGVTKEVKLAVDSLSEEIKDPWGNTKIGASATAKINRKDFGIVWNKALDAGGVAVGDDVSITIDVELTKKS